MKKTFTTITGAALLASIFTLSASAATDNVKKTHNMENKIEMKEENKMDMSAGVMATGTEAGDHNMVKKEEKMMKKEEKVVKKEEKAVKKVKKTHKVSHKKASTTDVTTAH